MFAEAGDQNGPLPPEPPDNLKVAPGLAPPPKGPSSRGGLGLALVFLMLASGITATGIFSFRNYDRHNRLRAEADLLAIADLKVGELVRWRRERLGDGGTLYNNPAFSTLVQRFFENSDDTEAQRLLKSWINRVQDQANYEQIVLVDTSGTVRLSVPEGSSPIPHLAQDAVVALSSGQISFLDFHRHTPDSPVRLGMVVPLFDDRDGGRPLGLVALSTDPAAYLYPYIQRWPTPSPTAETLLVRREGNEVVFLNDLRFQPNAALNLRASLDQNDLPAVMVASGTEGVVEGIDYRGVPVLAALRAIPDSPWFLVARKDAAEVFGPLRERLWVTVLLIVFLLASSGAGIGLIWWWQGVRFYRERAESAGLLQKSESLLARAEHLGKTGGWEFDIDTQVQTWSDMVYQIHELDRGVDPTVSQGVSFYTPESRPIIERAVQEAIELGKPFDVELEIITAKGNHRQVHAIGTADLERRIVSGFFQDITERKQAEAALAEGSRKLLEVQRMAQLGHWHWDVSTGSVEWSEEVYKIFRLDPDTFTPHIDSILELSPWPEENARDQELINRAIESHEKGDYEQRFLRPDGSIGYYHSTFQGSYDDGGNLIAIVGSVMDITERKQAEAEINELNRNLEQRVQERTAELLGANQELDSFAYAVTHDLRAPLRAMSGFSQALVEDYGETIPEEGRGFLDQITQASHRMGNLIEGLLKLSRSTRGTMQRDVVDLSALATRLLAELWAAEPDRRMFSTVTPGMTAWGDEGMIEVVLANLLGNAWKYTAKTLEPQIEFGVKEKGDDSGPEPSQHSTVYFVRDNGAGFDPKHSAKLFQPFQRLHREDEFPGVGIGLATAQRIVLRHGGMIQATAEPGNGATFLFSLSPANVTNEVES